MIFIFEFIETLVIIFLKNRIFIFCVVGKHQSFDKQKTEERSLFVLYGMLKQKSHVFHGVEEVGHEFIYYLPVFDRFTPFDGYG